MQTSRGSRHWERTAGRFRWLATYLCSFVNSSAASRPAHAFAMVVSHVCELKGRESSLRLKQSFASNKRTHGPFDLRRSVGKREYPRGAFEARGEDLVSFVHHGFVSLVYAMISHTRMVLLMEGCMYPVHRRRCHSNPSRRFKSTRSPSPTRQTLHPATVQSCTSALLNVSRRIIIQ